MHIIIMSMCIHLIHALHAGPGGGLHCGNAEDLDRVYAGAGLPRLAGDSGLADCVLPGLGLGCGILDLCTQNLYGGESSPPLPVFAARLFDGVSQAAVGQGVLAATRLTSSSSCRARAQSKRKPGGYNLAGEEEAVGGSLNPSRISARRATLRGTTLGDAALSPMDSSVEARGARGGAKKKRGGGTVKGGQM